MVVRYIGAAILVDNVGIFSSRIVHGNCNKQLKQKRSRLSDGERFCFNCYLMSFEISRKAGCVALPISSKSMDSDVVKITP